MWFSIVMFMFVYLVYPRGKHSHWTTIDVFDGGTNQPHIENIHIKYSNDSEDMESPNWYTISDHMPIISIYHQLYESLKRIHLFSTDSICVDVSQYVPIIELHHGHFHDIVIKKSLDVYPTDIWWISLSKPDCWWVDWR